MVDLRKKVACIRECLEAEFEGDYVAELMGDNLVVRSEIDDVITVSLINFVCGLGTEFICCYLDGGRVWALFYLD